MTLTIEFCGGATAVVGWSAGSGGVDLMVLGNHGALYHDFGSAAQREEAPGAIDQKPDAAVLSLIERALHSGGIEPR